MEGNSEKAEKTEQTATYRQIPESEMEENKTKSNTTLEADGADEQMLPKDDTELVPEKSGDVKFSVNEKQNGEMKVDIGDIKSNFVGISKEELMKYAKDPFWVRLRWVLFVSFWLLWLGMLAGAIAIIVAAPKCSPPAPRTWWEQGPLTEVEVDIPEEKLKEIKEDKFTGVIVSITNDAYNYENESLEVLEFLKQAKSLDINVILEFDPLKSDIWFEKSENKVDKYADYYIWANYKFMDSSDNPVEPNNWLSPLGGSAWHYSENRKQFYYAPFRKPQLNFRNEHVIEEFSSVLKYWIEQGAKGIRLRNISYMLVDSTLQNETFSTQPGFIHDQYQFYFHKKTVNFEGIGNVLAEWKTVVKNNTDNGPLMLKEDLIELDNYLVNDTLSIDLPRRTELFMNPKKLTSASQIYGDLESAFSTLKGHWPLWQVGDDMPLSSEVLQIFTMLLPGSQLLSPDNKPLPSLLKIREGASIMYGSCHRDLLANESIIAYSRIATGNPGYLVACNPGNTLVNVDFKIMPNVSSEVTIQVLSSNYSIPDMQPNLKIPADNVKMPPKSAVVLTYVPKS